MVEYYGSAPYTMRAIVAEMDGKIEGVIGLKRDIDHGLYFSDFHEKLRPYLGSVQIMRAVKASMEFVKAYPGPVFTIAEDAESCRILRRLGFEHMTGEWYAWLR